MPSQLRFKRPLSHFRDNIHEDQPKTKKVKEDSNTNPSNTSCNSRSQYSCSRDVNGARVGSTASLISDGDENIIEDGSNQNNGVVDKKSTSEITKQSLLQPSGRNSATVIAANPNQSKALTKATSLESLSVTVGHAAWSVQALPTSEMLSIYPDMKQHEPSIDSNPISRPCTFFDACQAVMISDRGISTFTIGIQNRSWTACSSDSFVISLGEIWGYLQKNRTWPGGYSSDKIWRHHDSSATSAVHFPSNLTVLSTTIRPEQPLKTSTLQTSITLSVQSRTTPSAQSSTPQFTLIGKSFYAHNVPSRLHNAESLKCSCMPDGSACSDTTCLNVASRYWCDNNCDAGHTCANQPFSLRNSCKVSAFHTTDQRGWGLRADELIRKGSFIISYVGEILDRKALSLRLEEKRVKGDTEYYIMETNDDYFIDAEHYGNLSRFINSSCEANSESQKWTDPATGQTHVGIFALKDITSGTEITYNYLRTFGFGFDNSEVRVFECRCRAYTCCMFGPAERNHVDRCVGRRIRVRWDDGWYLGRVHSYSQQRKRFRVEYDDGDVEELTLGLPTLSNGDGVDFILLDENDKELKSDM